MVKQSKMLIRQTANKLLLIKEEERKWESLSKDAPLALSEVQSLCS